MEGARFLFLKGFCLSQNFRGLFDELIERLLQLLQLACKDIDHLRQFCAKVHTACLFLRSGGYLRLLQFIIGFFIIALRLLLPLG